MVWNVDPVLLKVGFFELRYYSLMFVIGFIVMGQYVQMLFKQYGKDPELVSSLTTHIIIGMLLGARLGHCLFYEPDYYLSNPLEMLKVWEGGLASHGGYLGVFIALTIFIKKHKDIKLMWLLDLIVGPCIFVGGLIRIGNLFNSEIIGIPTDGPWGVIFERIDSIPRHPAQVYEAIGYILIAVILHFAVKYRFGKWPYGSIFSLSLILGFLFRFFVEFIKDEQSELILTQSLNMGQLLSLVFVLAGTSVMIWSFTRPDYRNQKTSR